MCLVLHAALAGICFTILAFKELRSEIPKVQVAAVNYYK